MKHLKLIPTLAIIAIALIFTGCEQKGPAEQAGEKIDQTMDNMKDKGEEAGDTAMDKLEETGDKVE